MKYLTVLLDGMADHPLEELGGKTPLEAAEKPVMDALAPMSELGILHVTPPGCKGGSEVGNLSILGYDPRVCLTGRAAIEAAAIGVEMEEEDLANRCNFVTLSDDEPYEKKTMVDYSAGEITTAEADQLIRTLNEHFANEKIEFFTGISYRHCLRLRETGEAMTLTPPHNISGKRIEEYLPQDEETGLLIRMMRESYEILKDHPVNIARRARGQNPANSVWFWGQGRKMMLASFAEKFGVQCAMISAVDLLKGIARCAEMPFYEVEGATGTLETNFDGKAAAAIRAFEDGNEMVYIHLEASDECGHHGDGNGKKLAAELIDQKIVAPVLTYLRNSGEPFRILFTPDHPTLVSTRGHSSEDVPYMIYDSTLDVKSGQTRFDETSCRATNNYRQNVFELMYFVTRE